MAKQKGIFPLVGTIGGVNFYYLNGKPVARMAGGGFNGEAIKSKDSMQRVRENGSEFGHCSRVNKIFRQALRPVHNFHKFTFYHSRLMTLFTAIKDVDGINLRGERRVAEGMETATGRQLLQDFKYTPKCVPLHVFPFDYTMDWTNFTLHFERIHKDRVLFIEGATHVSLQFGVLDFNFNTLDYDLQLGAPLMLSKTFSDTSISLSPLSLPTNHGLQLAVLGIRYYQEVDGVMYLLHAQNGVGIAVVSVV